MHELNKFPTVTALSAELAVRAHKTPASVMPHLLSIAEGASGKEVTLALPGDREHPDSIAAGNTRSNRLVWAQQAKGAARLVMIST